jgi:hypothetical protein
MKNNGLAFIGCAASLAAAFAGGACSTTTACAVNSAGVAVCDTYAGAYPYDYVYVDPLYASSGAYYPYTVDTYYDPLGYSTIVYALPAAPVPIADATMGSDVPELLDKAHRAANAINAGVRAALDPIKELIRTPPTENGDDTIVYGPGNVGNGNYQFTMNRLSESEKRFGWKLEARAAGSTGSFTRVAGGLIRVGNTERRGRGSIGVDCDALSAADSLVMCRGTLLTGFSHTDAGDKILNVRLRAYTPDANAVMPQDASVFAWRQGDMANHVRVVARTNLSSTATPAPETVTIKLTWMKDVGVRADGAATGGDIPQGEIRSVSTCVGPDLAQAGAMTMTRTCSSDGTGCDVTSGPDTLSCPAGLTEQTPNPDATASDPPAGMPEMPEAPAAMPDGSGN